jgi:hypothetical protein
VASVGDQPTALPTLPGTSGGDVGQLPPPPGQPIITTTSVLGPPSIPTDIPKKTLELYYRDVHTKTMEMGLPDWAAHIIAAIHTIPTSWMVQIANAFVGIIAVIVDPIARVVLGGLDELRIGLDPIFSNLAVSVLGELMGAELDAGMMPTGSNFSAHLQRADKLGGVFHSLLLSEFAGKSELTPEDGVKAAQRFSGLVINFGTATGIIAALGGLFPEIRLEELRQIGEEVAKNLGLGRLHRIAMMPLFHIMMAVPYTWYLNLTLRPTQFAVSELVNPYTGVVMNSTLVHDSLARLGYSDDKIAALIDLHKKRLPFSDLFALHARGILDDAQYAKLCSEQGIPDSDRGWWEDVELHKQEAVWEKEVVSAAADAYRFGNITLDELTSVANTFLHDKAEITLFLMAQQYKRKVPHRSLTVAEIEKFLVQGIFDISDFDDRLGAMGYDAADTAALRLFALETLQLDQAKAAAKAASAAAKAAKAATRSAPPTPPTTA